MFIDLPMARDLLNKALAIKGPDHVQTTCNYVVVNVEDEHGEREVSWEGDATEPKPGCLVGTALWVADKDALLSVVKAHTEQEVNGNLIENILPELEKVGIEVDEDAVRLFREVQTLQDGRDDEVIGNQTWGKAIQIAADRLLW